MVNSSRPSGYQRQNLLQSSEKSHVLASNLGSENADLKYVIYTVIREDQIYDFLNDTEMVSKCDCFALMYDDADSLKFLGNIIKKLPRLVPKILIQSKSDLI